jgi:hypothetical protein
MAMASETLLILLWLRLERARLKIAGIGRPACPQIWGQQLLAIGRRATTNVAGQPAGPDA